MIQCSDSDASIANSTTITIMIVSLLILSIVAIVFQIMSRTGSPFILIVHCFRIQEQCCIMCHKDKLHLNYLFFSHHSNCTGWLGGGGEGGGNILPYLLISKK